MVRHRKHGSDTGADDTVTVKLHVFHEKHSPEGCKTEDIPKATVDVYDECGETKQEGHHQADQNGIITLSLAPSVYRLVPHLPEGHAGLYTRLANGFLVDAHEKSQCTIPIAYRTRPAELRASACLHEEHPAECPAYLPNVTFRLYPGTGVDKKVLRTITPTEHPWEAVFDDLAPGFYTLVTEMPSDAHYKTCCSTQIVHVCEGQSVDLGCGLCVEAITSDVTVAVHDECGNPIPDAQLVLAGPAGRFVGPAIKGGMYVFSHVPVGTYQLHLAGGKHTAGDGTKWQATGPATVQVGPSPQADPIAFELQQDLPCVQIEATDGAGRPQANALVEIYDATRTKVVATVVLDKFGKYTWPAPDDAEYYFALKSATSGPPARMFAANGQSSS